VPNEASSAKTRIELRLEQEIELRRLGFSYAAIAERMEISKSQAQRDIIRALRKLADTNRGKTEEWRELEVVKLDALERRLQAILRKHHVVLYKGHVVMQNDPATGKPEPLEDEGPILQAIRELRAVSERRCRLLGLDTPQRVEHTGGDGGPIKHEYDFAALTDAELEAEIIREAESIASGAAEEGEPLDEPPA